MDEGEPTFHEMYGIYIDYIRHENELINQRLNRFITLQTFLFATVGLVLGNGNGAHSAAIDGVGKLIHWQPPIVNFIFLLICIVGCSGSALTWIAVQSAEMAQRRVEALWAERGKSEAYERGYPALRGGGHSIREDTGFDHMTGWFPIGMPVVVGVFWIVAAIVLATASPSPSASTTGPTFNISNSHISVERR